MMYNNSTRRGNKIASAEKRNCAIQDAKRNVIRQNCSLLYLSLLFEEDFIYKFIPQDDMEKSSFIQIESEYMVQLRLPLL